MSHPTTELVNSAWNCWAAPSASLQATSSSCSRTPTIPLTRGSTRGPMTRRTLADVSLERAWERALQALRLLGGADGRALVDDQSVQDEVCLTVLGIGARRLVEEGLEGAMRDTISRTAEAVTQAWGSPKQFKVVRELALWTADRTRQPLDLLEAGLELDESGPRLAGCCPSGRAAAIAAGDPKLRRRCSFRAPVRRATSKASWMSPASWATWAGKPGACARVALDVAGRRSRLQERPSQDVGAHGVSRTSTGGNCLGRVRAPRASGGGVRGGGHVPGRPPQLAKSR